MGWNLAFSAGACAAGAALVSPRFAGALALGAALEAANFRSVWRSSERIFQASAGAGAAVGAFGARFVLLALVIGVALHTGVDAIGLVVGLSLIVPAALIAAWRARPPVLADAPALAPDDPAWERWSPWLAREILPDEESEE